MPERPVSESPQPARDRRLPAGAAQAAPPSAATRVREALRRDILAMASLPGTLIAEKELTERFGVSRTPVREALIKLREEGLVEIFPQAGTFVARIPAAAIPEAVFIRQTLESATVARLAARPGEIDLRRAEATIARQQERCAAGDQEGFHLADEDFHAALAAAAGHPGVWKIAQAAKGQIDRCRRMTLPVPGRMAAVIAEHGAILAAIAAGEVAPAQAAMEHHLGTLVPDLAALRRSHPHYFV